MTATASILPDDPRISGWGSLFWKVFERSANPMVVLEADRRVIVALNGAATRLTGYQPSEVVGRPADDFFAPNWRRVRKVHWETLFRTGAVHGNREVRRKEGDGVYVRFEATLETVDGQELVLWVVLESALKVVSTRSEQQPGPLTAREIEVVAGLAVGKRVREIASDLVISPATAQTHIRNAMAKLTARSQAHLVATALATGLLDPDLVDRAA